MLQIILVERHFHRDRQFISPAVGQFGSPTVRRSDGRTLPYDIDGVTFHACVVGEQRHFLADRLGHQNAVKWITMMIGQLRLLAVAHQSHPKS